MQRFGIGFKIGLLAFGMVGLTTLAHTGTVAFWGSEPAASFVTGLAMLPLGFAIAWWQARKLTRELDQITSAAERLAQGERGEPLEVKARDQVGKLAKAFNKMATEIQAQQQALAESAERNKTILRLAADGIITFHEGGVIRTFNRAAEKIFGCEAKEVVHRNLRDLLPDAVTQTQLDEVAQLLRQDSPEALPVTLEMVGQRKDGTAFPMEVAVSLVRTGAGTIVTAIVRDITDRKEAKENLERAVRERTAELEQVNLNLKTAKDAIERAMKDQEIFMSSLSHDMRTPLTVILGYAEDLFEQVRSSEQETYKHDLDLIVRAGNDLRDLIRDSLNYYKVGQGERIPLRIETIDLAGLIEARREAVEYVARQRNNRFEVVGLAEAGTLHADRYYLWRILSNLLTNACKFTENGRITLEVSRDDLGSRGHVIFRVRDTGIGIPPNKVPDLFKRFGLTHDSEPRGQSGIGLGLSICKTYCELMGGEIELEVSSDHGSSFAFRLPVVVTAEPLPSAAARTSFAFVRPEGALPEPTVGNRLLIIDDDKPVCDLLERRFRAEGYQTRVALTGLTGLADAHRLLPAVIILDLRLPDLDGWAVLAALKNDRKTARIPVIVLTVVDDQPRGYALGAHDYLIKPFHFADLAGALRTHLQPPNKIDVLVVARSAETRKELCQTLAGGGLRVAEAPDADTALGRIREKVPTLILLDLRSPDGDGFSFIEQIRCCKEWEELPVVILTNFEADGEQRWQYQHEVTAILQRNALERDDFLDRIHTLVAESAQQRLTFIGES